MSFKKTKKICAQLEQLCFLYDKLISLLFFLDTCPNINILHMSVSFFCSCNSYIIKDTHLKKEKRNKKLLLLGQQTWVSGVNVTPEFEWPHASLANNTQQQRISGPLRQTFKL